MSSTRQGGASTSAAAAQDADRQAARSETIDLAEGGAGSETKTASSASGTQGGEELVDPSTIDGDQWAVFKKGRTWYWRFFRRGVCDGKYLETAMCLICSRTLSCKASSNLMHHLQQHHQKHTLVREAKAAHKQQAARVASRTGSITPFVKVGLTKEARNELILIYVVKDLQGFDTVESPHFRTMICGLTRKPDFQFPGVKTLVNAVSDKTEEVRNILRGKVDGKPLALTGDGWESRAGQHYYSLTAHVVDDDDNQLKTFTLACRKLEGSQTGERIAELNNELLGEYCIRRSSITAFTTDTASNQKKAIRLMDVPWLACSNHVLELSTGVVAKHPGVKEAIQAAKAVVAFTHRSAPGRDELKRAQRGWNLPDKKLSTFSETRWWTLTDLVESVSINQKAISTMCHELERKDPKTPVKNLTDHQFMICKDLLTILAEPRELQRQLEGESYVTISNVDLAVCGMLQVLSSAQTDVGLCEEVQAVALAVEMDMLARWYPEEAISSARSKKKIGKPLRLARIAAALDPRTKDCPQATKRERKDMYFFPIREELIQKAKDKANNDAMLEDHRMREGNNHLTDDEDEAKATPDKSVLSRMLAKAKKGRALDLDTTSSDDDGPAESDDGADWEGGAEGEGEGGPPPKENAPRRGRKVPKLTGQFGHAERLAKEYVAELERYRKSGPVSLASVRSIGGPLAWWKTKEEIYPTLAPLARKYLAVQATSASSERLFSTAGNTVTVKRSRLTDENVENIVFLHSNQELW